MVNYGGPPNCPVHGDNPDSVQGDEHGKETKRMDAMRSTVDLINELQQEAQGSLLTALVVGSERATTYVWAADEMALEILNHAVRNGGNPVGYVTINRDANNVNIGCWPLAEHAGNEEVEASLKELAVGLFFRFSELNSALANTA